MPTTYANSINNNPIYAARADADAAGNSISTTYATKSELPSGVPAVTSSDDSKVLKATYSGGVGSYAWETESGGASYTAGDGISIANDEISAKAGTGLEIADVSESTTDNLVCATMSGNWAYDVCPMTQALADIMNTSDGYTFTLAKPFDISQMYVWPCIAKTSELNQGELQHYAFFGNYLTIYTPSTDGSGRLYEVSAGTQLTLKFSERDQYSTVTVADILNDLSNYSLVILWYDEDSPYAAETMLSTAMTPETTATHTTTTNIQDAICVKNPLPASTVSDVNKVLTVNAQGTPAWASVPPANAIILTSSSTWSDFHAAYSTGRKDIYYKHTNPYSPFDSRAELYLLLTAVSDVDGTSSNFTFALFEGAWANGGVDYSVRCKLKYNGSPTVSATSWVVDQSYSSSSKNAQSGKAVAQAISAVSQVPAVTSSDDAKVLKATYSGGVGSYAWETESGGGTTYTAGNMISLTNNAIAVSTTAGITDIQQVASLPANPVATVLYLIPET